MPSFEILPGDPNSTVIIHVPHGGLIIPESVRADIVLTNAELAEESITMSDIATDQLARDAYVNAGIKPWVFINNYSRLVIDPERFPDEREEMNAVGMGVVYTKTSDQRMLRQPDSDRDAKLVAEYFTPYAEALSNLTAQVREAHQRVTILDLHSFAPTALPYELHKHDARPALCLGTDDFHTSPTLIDQAHMAFSSVGSIAIDQPFSGTYVPLAFYKVDAAVQSLMLEIRKDTYAFGDYRAAEYRDVVTACIDLVHRIETDEATDLTEASALR